MHTNLWLTLYLKRRQEAATNYEAYSRRVSRNSDARRTSYRKAAAATGHPALEAAMYIPMDSGRDIRGSQTGSCGISIGAARGMRSGPECARSSGCVLQAGGS
jgi:hypothetical protein